MKYLAYYEGCDIENFAFRDTKEEALEDVRGFVEDSHMNPSEIFILEISGSYSVKIGQYITEPEKEGAFVGEYRRKKK